MSLVLKSDFTYLLQMSTYLFLQMEAFVNIKYDDISKVYYCKTNKQNTNNVNSQLKKKEKQRHRQKQKPTNQTNQNK